MDPDPEPLSGPYDDRDLRRWQGDPDAPACHRCPQRSPRIRNALGFLICPICDARPAPTKE